MAPKDPKTILESNIEQRLRDRVRAIGGEAYKFESPGQAGVPDRIVVLPGGRVYFIETKRPKGGVVEKRQGIQHRKLRRLGADVRVISTHAAIDDFIEEVSGCNSNPTTTSDTPSSRS